jgi:hypothetical protein
MKIKNIDLIRVQTIVLGLLMLATPYALTFTPYEKILEEGVWNVSLQSDPIFYQRAIFIIGGLLAGVLSAIVTFEGLNRQNFGANNQILLISMGFCSLTIGWIAFPYWINGVFQSYSGLYVHEGLHDFDPEALLPTIWIGEIWPLAVLGIFLLVLCGGPLLFLANIIFTLRNRSWMKGVVTIVFLVITSLIYIFLLPKYGVWIGD